MRYSAAQKFEYTVIRQLIFSTKVTSVYSHFLLEVYDEAKASSTGYDTSYYKR